MSISIETYTTKEGNIAVRVIEGDHILLDQPFNPSTGLPFATEEEARKFAEDFVNNLSSTQNPTENDKPYLEVKFLDKNGNETKIAKVGDPVTVHVLLYTIDDEGTKQALPLDGTYIVPYFQAGTENQVGAVAIDITNGEGSGVITFKNSGVFEVQLDKILNAKTMQPPSPLPILKDNPRIAIVEPLEQTTTTSTQ